MTIITLDEIPAELEIGEIAHVEAGDFSLPYVEAGTSVLGGTYGIVKFTASLTGSYSGQGSAVEQEFYVGHNGDRKYMSCVTGGTSRYGGVDGFGIRISRIFLGIPDNEYTRIEWGMSEMHSVGNVNVCGSWIGF